MHLADSTIWWLLAGAAIVAELLTGTFYLLMVSVGLVAGAVAAHLGLGTPMQLLAAAVVGGGAVVICNVVRSRRRALRPDGGNRAGNLDIGETVVIDAWNPDGTATVRYRGAAWTAIPRPGNAASTGAHRVAEVIGSRLVVDKI